MLDQAVRHVRTKKMRKHDERPYSRPDGARLGWPPCRPFRWLPRHGKPTCVLEWIAQRLVRTAANPAVYTAIVVTAILAIQIFGLPGGK